MNVSPSHVCRARKVDKKTEEEGWEGEVERRWERGEGGEGEIVEETK